MMISKVVRRTHMYLALFLFPWVLMYALSTLVMNHRALFVSAYGEGPGTVCRGTSARLRRRLPRERRAQDDLEADPDVGRTRWRARRVATQGRNHRHQPERPHLAAAPHLLSSRSLTHHRTDATSPERVPGTVPSPAGYATGYALDTVWAVAVDLFIVGDGVLGAVGAVDVVGNEGDAAVRADVARRGSRSVRALPADVVKGAP